MESRRYPVLLSLIWALLWHSCMESEKISLSAHSLSKITAGKYKIEQNRWNPQSFVPPYKPLQNSKEASVPQSDRNPRPCKQSGCSGTAKQLSSSCLTPGESGLWSPDLQGWHQLQSCCLRDGYHIFKGEKRCWRSSTRAWEKESQGHKLWEWDKENPIPWVKSIYIGEIFILSVLPKSSTKHYAQDFPPETGMRLRTQRNIAAPYSYW